MFIKPLPSISCDLGDSSWDDLFLFKWEVLLGNRWKTWRSLKPDQQDYLKKEEERRKGKKKPSSERQAA